MRYHFIYKKALIIAIFFFIIFLAIFISFSALKTNEIKQHKIIDINNRLLDFQHRMESFIMLHTTMLYGFSAYINTFDEYSDATVYKYLKELTKNTEYIRNIGILKDTTIVWNYPRENNSAAIGVDLSKIESQAHMILKAKNELTQVFQGPINLIQGGIGYIIRIPLLKNNNYWGMISIVLDGDKFTKYLDDISRDTELNVLIKDHESDDSIMYGSEDVLNLKPHTYRIRTNFGVWQFSVAPKEGWNNISELNLFISTILGIILILPASYVIYASTRNLFEFKDKNALLKQTASTDKLTGIYNRSMLEAYIMNEINLSERYNNPLTVLILDLDHFKQINDSFGHKTGDLVLIEKVKEIKELIRKSDFFARWGGEEFIIVMPQTKLKDGVKVAEKIRIAQTNLNHQKAGYVTISIGIAQRLTNEYWVSLFKRIDTALYDAKNNGRNQISISAKVNLTINEHNKLDWSNDWLSGNQTIDKQHKQLVIDGNNLMQASKTDHTLFFRYYDDLVEHLKTHFHDEENILKKEHYPFLDEHSEIHKNLLTAILKTKERLLSNEIIPESIFDFLIDEVVLEHIIKEDLKFFNYLRNIG